MVCWPGRRDSTAATAAEALSTERRRLLHVRGEGVAELCFVSGTQVDGVRVTVEGELDRRGVRRPVEIVDHALGDFFGHAKLRS